ncbi:ABC transporter permease [Sporosarcina sp. 179-K 3D1 HS]|uniref:ABC transporter permease n=1 Tax=Sporosarcina sp. 179-K 3D1 HS TaxID=3232169 RepID=UPI0039A0E9C3
MNSLREIWSSRFIHYVTELQKYLKYVFTGHLALVLMFSIGAGGYAYSEWLKEVPSDFPAVLLTSVVIAATLAYSPSVTLLKPADMVFFLPFEQKMGNYIGRALRWTVFSQLALPLILYIVALPLLSATGTGSKTVLLWLAVFIVVIKWIFVETEYFFRHTFAGDGVWKDRFVRFILATLYLYCWLGPSPAVAVGFLALISLYGAYWRKRKNTKPFPYEHFITLEQNRMMRFYRFANYFTDVPHLKGSVSRRSWLGFLMGQTGFRNPAPQSYLLVRTFIRTDDIFWLWVRLTALSIVGVLFIPFPIVSFIYVGSLSFASAVQLIHALRAGDDFRMDRLFPEKEDSRPQAIRKLVRVVQWIQIVFVGLAACLNFGLSLNPLLIIAVMFIVSEATIRLTHEKEEWE